MSRPIDADALKAHYSWLGDNTELTKRDLNDIVDVQPTMDVAPVVHGEWRRGGTRQVFCSECGGKESARRPYCPNCGAKMDGGKQ